MTGVQTCTLPILFKFVKKFNNDFVSVEKNEDGDSVRILGIKEFAELYLKKYKIKNKKYIKYLDNKILEIK